MASSYLPAAWFVLSTVGAAAVAIALGQSWLRKNLESINLSEPISVKIISGPEKTNNPGREVVTDPEQGAGWGNDSWGAAGSESGWGAAKREKTEETESDSDAETLTSQHASEPLQRYCRLEQIWNQKLKKYVEYTARPPPEIPDDDELRYWFKVYSRRQTGHRDEKPYISIKFYSSCLINFLRTTLGEDKSFSSRPFIDIHKLFRLQRKFSKRLERMEPSELQTIDLKAKQELAHSLGVPDALNDNMDEPNLLKHFEILSRHLNHLVACLNKEFEPLREELKMYLSHGHITFELLPYMLEPGVKLLMHTNIGDKIAVRMKSTSLISRSDDESFVLSGTGRKWNGSEYGIAHHSRTVRRWKGTRSVTSLPWSILSIEDEQELTERGRIYCQYNGIHYVYNKGPLGGRGRAMVDCGHEKYPTVDEWGHQDNESDVEALRDQEEKDREHGADESVLPDDELCFLPPTVEGFMLRAKHWVTMHVLSLAPVEFDRGAWDHLVLDPDTKLLIRSLVDVTCKGIANALIQDVITGKGGGLVTVLHGKPGTGKTLTAEAIAEHLERPIYIVGSEELPFKPSQLESSLKGILALATRWDAVLLIDEADVFLEQRSMHELERNAVVSVALRLLEYHSGVIFLTTNRIKAFDEAFLSRFSIGIKYPDLDQASRLKIWGSFLRLANVEVVDTQESIDSAKDRKPRIFVKDLENLAENSFNGRSIKNIVRTAQALAFAHNEPLAIKHLRIVVKTSERFLRDFEGITDT